MDDLFAIFRDIVVDLIAGLVATAVHVYNLAIRRGVGTMVNL